MSRTLTQLMLSSFFLMILTAPVRATDIPTRGEIENLRQRIERLEGKGEEDRLGISNIPKYLAFWGAIEAEASYSQIEGGEDSSDFVLATALLGLDLEFAEYVGGHLVFLYEEGDTEPIEVAEANITIFKPFAGESRAGMVAGKMYFPFGHFNSAMISDPLTLEIGETNDAGLMLVLETDLVKMHVGAFNGEADTVDDHDNIDSVFASVALSPIENMVMGASYISDLAESDAGLVDSAVTAYESNIPAWSAYVEMVLGPLTFDVEHVEVMESFNPGAVGQGADLTGPSPKVSFVELGLVPGDSHGYALRYEKAHNYMDDISRYGGTVSYSMFDNTVLSLEYLLTDPKAEGSITHTVTCQLAVQF